METHRRLHRLFHLPRTRGYRKNVTLLLLLLLLLKYLNRLFDQGRDFLSRYRDKTTSQHARKKWKSKLKNMSCQVRLLRK
jgi:hypothetical protein